MESGSEPYMVYGFSALSSLMDYYFYTSANGECSREQYIVNSIIKSLKIRIASSTSLRKQNEY